MYILSHKTRIRPCALQKNQFLREEFAAAVALLRIACNFSSWPRDLMLILESGTRLEINLDLSFILHYSRSKIIMETYLDRLKKFDVEWEVTNCVRPRLSSQGSDSRSASAEAETRKRKLDNTFNMPIEIDTSDLM
jgi:hypothetical protein